jgi:hypothetical protein
MESGLILKKKDSPLGGRSRQFDEKARSFSPFLGQHALPILKHLLGLFEGRSVVRRFKRPLQNVRDSPRDQP